MSPKFKGFIEDDTGELYAIVCSDGLDTMDEPFEDNDNEEPDGNAA